MMQKSSHKSQRQPHLYPLTFDIRLRFLLLLLALLLAIATTSAPRLLNQQQLNALKNQYGQAAVDRILIWQQLLTGHRDETDMEKLILVNDYFNGMRFVDDMEHWGEKDYWATPIEFISTAAGDCEDFSIAKYFSLRELGVATEKLRLIYVKAKTINQAHMVLGYYETPDSEPVILDNIEPDIKPASSRQDLIPSYSFNGNSLWRSKMLREGGKKVGNSENIGIWRMLLKRIDMNY